MADNVTTQSATPATLPADVIVATVEASFSGQTVQAGVGVLAKSSGAEGSRSLTLISPATEDKQDTGNTSLSSIDGKITAVNTGAVVVSSSALPSGAATGAKQDTGNTSLSSIDGKLPALSGGSVPVVGPLTDTQLRASAVPVSAATLPLPSGASTAARQDTGNTSLASLDGKTPALGQALAVASVPVVLTAVQVSTLTPPAAITGFATESTLDARTGSLTETAPATDTASSGINGRLQRIAQRITSLIAALGSPFQAGGSIGNTAFGATQSGTWTVQPGNTANTTAWKVDGSAVTQPVSGTVTASPAQAASETLSNVGASATSVTLLAAATRKGAVFFNDSTSSAYIKLGATASLTSFTYKLFAYQTVELPTPVYQGQIDAIWDSATGNMRVTVAA